MPPAPRDSQYDEMLRLTRETHAIVKELERNFYTLESHVGEMKASNEGDQKLMNHRVTGLETSRDNISRWLMGIVAFFVTSTASLWFKAAK